MERDDIFRVLPSEGERREYPLDVTWVSLPQNEDTDAVLDILGKDLPTIRLLTLQDYKQEIINLLASVSVGIQTNELVGMLEQSLCYAATESPVGSRSKRVSALRLSLVCQALRELLVAGRIAVSGFVASPREVSGGSMSTLSIEATIVLVIQAHTEP